ncbi:MAG: hypothetical protein AABY22_30240 [Nanoarchaeota archaeon]
MEQNIEGKSKINMSYGTFLENLAYIKYGFIAKTGHIPKKILVSKQLSDNLGIQDMIEIFGFPIEIADVEDNRIKVQI